MTPVGKSTTEVLEITRNVGFRVDQEITWAYQFAPKQEVRRNGFIQVETGELEIYNRVLTPTEIAALFNAGSAGKCKYSPSAVRPRDGAPLRKSGTGRAGREASPRRRSGSPPPAWPFFP